MAHCVEKAKDELAFDLRNFGWTHGKRDIFQPGQRSLENVAEAAFKAGLDGIAIARCYDDRYETIRDTLDSGSYIEQDWTSVVGSDQRKSDSLRVNVLGESLYTVSKNVDGKMKRLYVMRGQMTPTCDIVGGVKVKAHPYALGYEGSIENNLPLEETLHEMKKKNALITMVHPFTKPFFGVGTEELSGAFLSKAVSYLDYLEWDAAIRGENNRKVQAYAKARGLPVVAVSNAHSPSQFGVSCIKFKEDLLDAYDEESFFASLAAVIKGEKFVNVQRQQSMRAVLWHYAILAAYTALGIARRDKSKR